jgi:hypothetical protein
MRSPLAAALCLTMLCGLPAAARAESPTKQFKLKIRVLEGISKKADEAAEIDVLSRPTMVTLNGQLGLIFVGQTVQNVKCGLTVKLVPTGLRDGRIRVQVSAVSVTPRPKENAKPQFEAYSSYGELTLEPGVRGSFVFGRGPGGKKLWVELHASVMPQ